MPLYYLQMVIMDFIISITIYFLMLIHTFLINNNIMINIYRLHIFIYFHLEFFYIFLYNHQNVLLNNEQLLNIVNLHLYLLIYDDNSLRLYHLIIFKKFNIIILFIISFLVLILPLLMLLNNYIMQNDIKKLINVFYYLINFFFK